MEIFGQLSEKFEASCLQSQHATDLRKEIVLCQCACLVNLVWCNELKNAHPVLSHSRYV